MWPTSNLGTNEVHLPLPKLGGHGHAISLLVSGLACIYHLPFLQGDSSKHGTHASPGCCCPPWEYEFLAQPHFRDCLCRWREGAGVLGFRRPRPSLGSPLWARIALL